MKRTIVPGAEKYGLQSSLHSTKRLHISVISIISPTFYFIDWAIEELK